MCTSTAIHALNDWRHQLLSEDEVISIHSELVRYSLEEWEQLELLADAMLQSPCYDANTEISLCLAVEQEAWLS